MPNFKEMSMLECAEIILRDNNGPMNIFDIINKVLEEKQIVDEDNDISTQLYTDMVLSSKFVYMGDAKFNLKELESLEQYEKDSSSFVVATLEDEAEDDLELAYDDDDEYDDYDEDEEDDFDDEDDFVDEDEDDSHGLELEDDASFEHDEDGNLLDRYSEDDDFDEDKYNTYMDDYEDKFYDN